MLVSLTAGGSIASAAQAPTSARTAAIAAVPNAAATVTSVIPLDTASATDAITVPNVPVMAAAYYGTSTYTSCTPSCDLYARAGTITLPGAVAAIPIWGYATGTDTFHPVTAPGPILTVTEGDAALIRLHNDLAEPTSLTIAQAGGVPDMTGAAAGATKDYTFAAGELKAGTYLYQAGLTLNGPRQVAMGLVGALVVQPATPPTNSGEAVVVLTEIDPALNAAPTTFSLAEFLPKFWLINGKVYPNTDPIATTAGDTVRLRYVNASLTHHSMSLAGARQTIIAVDTNTLANPSRLVAFTIPAGGTADAIAQIPATAPADAKYALYDAAPHLDNNGALAIPAATNPAYTPIAFGGMLTFLTTAAGAAPVAGPLTTGVTLTPSVTGGSTSVALSATFGSAPTTAEYFVDGLGTSTLGCAMTVSGSSAASTIAVSGATAPCVDLSTLASGDRTFYVHAQNANGWGSFGSAVLTLDKTGPAISSVTVTPNPTNGVVDPIVGTTDVTLQATASDVATGNQNVTAAEWTLNGTTTPFTFTAGNVASLTALIPFATVAALPAEGPYTISIRAQDAFGYWGAPVTTTLTFDKTGPTASALVTTPDPTNGTFGVQNGSIGLYWQRLEASISDAAGGGSNIVAAEYFVDAAGANGTGGGMVVPLTLNSVKTVYQLINLPFIQNLSQGQHTLFVHGKDAAGNWGSTSTVTFTVDKTGPAITAVTLAPNPTAGASTVTFDATATDPANTGTPANAPASNVTAWEYTLNGVTTSLTIATPAPSVNLHASINVSTLPAGSYTLSVRAQDAAHNWGPTITRTLTVTGPGGAVAPIVGGGGGGGAVAPVTPVGPAAQAPVNAPTTVALRAKPSPLHAAPFAIVSDRDAYHAEWVAQSAYPTARAGQIAEWVVAFKNTGTAGWYRGILGANAALGSAEPLNNESAALLGMDPGNWQYASRFAVQTTEYVAPGQIGWFVMQVRAPSSAGTYRFAIRPVIDGVSWLEDYGVYFDLTVLAP
jgi:hypothetical protein